MKLSAHFSLSEFITSNTATARKIDNTPTAAAVANLQALCANVLEPLRVMVGQPVIISSGYRSPALNAAVGGSRTSQHMTGQAADIKIGGIPHWDLAKLIIEHFPFDQIILEFVDRSNIAAGWVHVSYAPRCRKSILTISKSGTRVGLHF